VSKARLIITAVVLEGRAQAEVAREYGVSKGWVSKLVARYRIEGDAAFEPRSRRRTTNPESTPTATVELIIGLRRQLSAQGLDAGADTIGWHLVHHHHITVSRATIYRILRRANTITPTPAKRPKNSYIRFQAELPNECWQSDFTHYRLTTGADAEIITWLDDHSRFALAVTAHHRITGPIVVTTFRHAINNHGAPLSTLTDNGLVYTTRFARGGNDGRNQFETELVQRRIIQKNSRPNHPTTCGKVERFQQTLKQWLRAQPHQPTTIDELQTLCDTFVGIYNHHRPHRSLEHHATPAAAYLSRPKTGPGQRDHDPHHRVRHDKVGAGGKVTLRHNGHLYKIGVGRTHTRTPIVMLIVDLDIRIIHAATGEILRTLTLDPTRTYQPTGKPQGAPPGPRKPQTPEPK
jgi:transposase InsO family protein